MSEFMPGTADERSADTQPDSFAAPEPTLDPADWEEMRAIGHRMIDDVIAYHRGIRDRPAWRTLPEPTIASLARALPREPQGAGQAYADFREHVLPYPYGNIHPRAWGWVNGTGTTIGAFADMLGATMNPNVWAGQQSATHVEAAVLDFVKGIVGYDPASSGVLVSGASTANFVCLAAGRDAALGGEVSRTGVHGLERRPVMYASEQVHNSVDKAAGLLGIGWHGVRRIRVDDDYRMDTHALESAIEEDREAGLQPICVAATAGTVNTGAIDPLDTIADLCAKHGLWMHVDGAFGAMAGLSARLRPMIRGIERADSVAVDLHKWLYVPIGVACALVRDPAAHRAPFSPPASYLAGLERGVTAGPHNYSMLSPELTRPFRALKVWMSLKTHGTDAYVRQIEHNVEQAKHLARLVDAHDELERLAPAPLNVVCFRYRRHDAGRTDWNAVNREIVMRLQESGSAIPSSTVLSGAFALRCAFTNHRTRAADIQHLVNETVRIGRTLTDMEAGMDKPAV